MRMKPDPKTADGKVVKRAAATWMSRTVGKKETAVFPDGSNKVRRSLFPPFVVAILIEI